MISGNLVNVPEVEGEPEGVRVEVGVEAPGAVLAVHAHTAGAARLPPPGVDQELRDLGHAVHLHTHPHHHPCLPTLQ